MGADRTSVTTILSKINKKYGPGTILRGDEIKRQVIPRITTGSLNLDAALGGGWAANAWNEIIGSESSGKTALVLKTIAANQALDPNWRVAWFASEDFVVSYAEMCGVDLERVIVINDNTMETVYQTAIDLAESREIDCIVIDSLPALVSVREDDATMEDLQPGQAAFLTGKFFRKAGSAIKRSLIEEERPVTGLIINQWRERIGVMHGDPRTTPGGKAKNFYYLIRLEAAREEWIQNTRNNNIGQVIKARIIKNKTAPPRRVASVAFYFAKGGGFEAGDFDVAKDIVESSIQAGVVERAGAWYRFGGEQWQGKDAFADAVREEPKLQAELRDAVLNGVEAEVEAEVVEEGSDEPEPLEPPKKKAVRRKRG